MTGTIPGTEEERLENAAALRGERTDDGRGKPSRHKKPYLGLVLECLDGQYLVDRVPARSAAGLRLAAARMAEECGIPLLDGE